MDPSFKICVGSAHAISFYALLDLQKKGKIDQKWVHCSSYKGNRRCNNIEKDKKKGGNRSKMGTLYEGNGRCNNIEKDKRCT